MHLSLILIIFRKKKYCIIFIYVFPRCKLLKEFITSVLVEGTVTSRKQLMLKKKKGNKDPSMIFVDT